MSRSKVIYDANRDEDTSQDGPPSYSGFCTRVYFVFRILYTVYIQHFIPSYLLGHGV